MESIPLDIWSNGYPSSYPCEEYQNFQLERAFGGAHSLPADLSNHTYRYDE